MKKVIRANTEQKTFRIYYKDGNQKLFGGSNIYEVLSYVLFEQGDDAEDIYKIEEIEDKSVNAASYVLKDLDGDYYFSKHSTGKEWTDNKDYADRFESREDVIDFGNKYFEGTYLYGRDWAEVKIEASTEGEYNPYARGTYRVTGGLESKNFDDPAKAIEMWFKFQAKHPYDVSIMCETRDQAIALCEAATEDLLLELADKYKCPYKVDYLIDAAAEKVADGQKYFYENDYGYGDVVHPFGNG